MRALATIMLLAAIAGCAAPSGPTVKWDESENPVHPRLTPDREGRGRVVVKTQAMYAAFARSPDDAVRFRGYELFDDEGKLVYSCRSLYDPEDVRWLAPGRYIAIATVVTGWLTTHEARVQFYVEPHETTFVDLTRIDEIRPTQ